MKKVIIIGAILALTAGCTVRLAAVTTIEAAAQTMVSLYCKAPQHLRSVNRSIVANAIRPNKIEITCAENVQDAK